MKVPAMRGGLVFLLASTVLAGCVEDAPPKQTTAARVEMTGTVTGGVTSGPGEYVYEVTAKGTSGRMRTTARLARSLQYAVSLTSLAGPYALSALVQGADDGARVYGLASTQGHANLTPLTSLLIAQLYGQDPAAVFQGFGAGGSTDPSRITTANLAAAQTALTAFVQEELGIDIPAAAGDFITAPFVPAAGDPMYDSIAAIFTRLDELGITPQQFTTSVAQAARLCLTERVAVTTGGTTTDFCPETKSATAADDDEDRLDYVFVDRHGNTLTVVVDGGIVAAVRYESEAGSTWQCADAQCTGPALGEPTEDLTRPMHFGNLVLAGAEGNAIISGSLTGAIPGVTLPVLPCDANRFFVVFPDRNVAAACVDPDQYGFGIGAYLGDFQGVEPSRVQYRYAVLGENDPTRPQVTVVTDANDAVLAVQFLDYEPGTFDPRRVYGCRLEECSGITLGEVTQNVDALGVPILIRTVTFQNTLLAGRDEDGNETGDSVELIASLNTAWIDWVAWGFMEPIQFPPPGSCGPEDAAIAGDADGTLFDLCLSPTGAALEQSDGSILLVVAGPATDNLRVLLRDGAVAQATVSIRNQRLDFICNGSGGCDGITLSAPDGEGRRTLQFDAAMLHEALIDRLGGTRTLVLDGGEISFDAPVPAS